MTKEYMKQVPTDELKPCPFCGSEAKLWEYPQALHTHINPKKTTYYKAKCMNPDCNVWHPSWDDQQVAIDRWNTRAERTCKMELNQLAGMYQCSECGEYSVTAAWQKKQGHLNWCAKCGAKVVCDD